MTKLQAQTNYGRNYAASYLGVVGVAGRAGAVPEDSDGSVVASSDEFSAGAAPANGEDRANVALVNHCRLGEFAHVKAVAIVVLQRA